MTAETTHRGAKAGNTRLGGVLAPLCVVVVMLAYPAPAAAQKDEFFDPLITLYRALAGTYGDEGAELTAHVETMAAALDRWDAAIRDTERELLPQLETADAKTALQIHTVLASTYLDRARFADAVREFDADVKIDPTRAAFHRFKALALQALNRPQNAADALRAAWLAEPTDPQNAYYLIVHRARQTTAAELARAVDALGGLERALVRGEAPRPDAPFLSLRPINDDAGGAMAFAPAAYARAFSTILAGGLAAGIKDLRQTIAADPLVADPALRLDSASRGIAALRRATGGLQASGDLADAIRSLQAALALAPKSAQLHRILGIAYGVNGDVASSLQHLRESVRLDPRDERSWLALARTLDEIGEWVEAADVLRNAVAALPDSGELRWQLSTISGKRQQTDEADLDLIAIADRLVLLAGKGELNGRVAALAQAHLEYDRALALLEQRVGLTPNHAAAHLALGRAYMDQAREEEAYAELVIALWLEPADAGTLTAIGRLHLGADRHDRAVEALTRAVGLAPASAEAMHALGEALTRSGRTAEGRQRLEEAERLRARVVETGRRLRTAGMLALEADVQMAQGDYARAVETWREVMALEGRSGGRHVRVAEALVRAGRPEEAVEELLAAITADAGVDAYRRLADVYAALGRPEESARARRAYTERRLRELRERGGGF